MKKAFILSAFMVVSCLLQAQSVGIRVGANISNININPSDLTTLGLTKEKLLGMALSVPVTFKVHKNVSIQTELGFLQKGFKSVQSVRAGTTDIKTELKNYTNYVEIPVMLQLHTASRLVQVYANVGPDAAWAMQGRSTGTTTTTNDGVTNSANVNETISFDGQKRLAIGLQGGGGIRVKLGKTALVLDGRFLTSLKDEQGKFNIAGLKDKFAKTQGWATSMGIVFGL
jgi:hypothetical protein